MFLPALKGHEIQARGNAPGNEFLSIHTLKGYKKNERGAPGGEGEALSEPAFQYTLETSCRLKLMTLGRIS